MLGKDLFCSYIFFQSFYVGHAPFSLSSCKVIGLLMLYSMEYQSTLQAKVTKAELDVL